MYRSTAIAVSCVYFCSLLSTRLLLYALLCSRYLPEVLTVIKTIMVLVWFTNILRFGFSFKFSCHNYEVARVSRLVRILSPRASLKNRSDRKLCQRMRLHFRIPHGFRTLSPACFLRPPPLPRLCFQAVVIFLQCKSGPQYPEHGPYLTHDPGQILSRVVRKNAFFTDWVVG